jgi:hypothetical protein
MQLFKRLIYLFSLILSQHGFSQYHHNISFDDLNRYFDKDSTKLVLQDFSSYHRLPYSFQDFYFSLGTIDSRKSMLGNVINQSSNRFFNTGIFQPIVFLPNKVLISDKVITDVFYHSSPNVEQLINVNHVQVFNNKFGYNFGFNKSSSTGDFQFQKGATTNISGNVFYQSKQFSSILTYQFFKNELTENGGVILDNVSAQDFFSNKKYLPVYLSNAISFNRNHEVTLFNQINLNKQFHDSVSRVNKKFIFHSFNYNTDIFNYTDLDSLSNLYPKYFGRNSDVLMDSINVKIVSNQLGWSNFKRNSWLQNIYEPNKLYFSNWFEHEYIEFSQNFHKYYFVNYALGLDVKYFFKDNFIKQVNLTSKYVFTGYNNGDFKGSLQSLFYNDSANYKLKMGLDFSILKSSFLQRYYSNSSLVWENYFKRVSQSHIYVDYLNDKLRLNLNYDFYFIKNFIGYGLDARPFQYNGLLSWHQIQLKKHFTWKKLNLVSALFVNHINNQQVFSVPLFSTYQSFYFETNVFRKALRIQLGVDALFFTQYYAQSYLPVSRQFYNQNEVLSGNYPFLDFYLNAKIKNAFIFVKISHLNADFMGIDYQITPNYPIQRQVLKFGVKWRFLN